MKTQQQRGFTLIELLIVVAIIAILAAIAVPNFLEAQVRAKVSRCKADMRSIRTALEAYAVDNNKYIIDLNGDAPFFTMAQMQARWPNANFGNEYETWTQLTTPISYITSVIYPPFQAGDPSFDNNPYGGENVYEYWGWPFLKRDIGFENIVWGRLEYKFVISSLGPNLKRDNFFVDAISYVQLDAGEAIIYDPTNGTTSDGDIVSTNKVSFK